MNGRKKPYEKRGKISLFSICICTKCNILYIIYGSNDDIYIQKVGITRKRAVNRILQTIIVLFGISFLTFGLTYLSPGDPAEIMLTECGNLPTQEMLEKTREEMGLNEPFLIQYGNWMKGVLTGDMGMSYSAKIPVSEKIRKSF